MTTLAPEQATTVGVIRYDFAHERTPPLRVVAADGSIWRGFRSVVALGYRHVALGYDHLLFLAARTVNADAHEPETLWRPGGEERAE